MRLVGRFLITSAVLLLLISAGLVWAMLMDTRLVPEAAPLSHHDIRQVHQLLELYDPRRRPPGSLQRLQIPQRHLQVTANYFARRWKVTLVAEILADEFSLHASRAVHFAGSERFFNLQLSGIRQNGTTTLRNVRLGRLAINDRLSNLFLDIARRLLNRSEQFRTITGLIRSVEFADSAIRLQYEWQPAVVDTARNQVFGKAGQNAQAAYFHRLYQRLKAGADPGGLTALLPPLFEFAAGRSVNGDPVNENRSLLLVLGAWAGNRGMSQLVPQSRRAGKLPPFRFELNGRGDSAQHFLVSAALTAGGDTMLSNAVGLFKELQDSRIGSGFSFSDLTADRAGTLFGKSAVESPKSARRLQQRLADGIKDTDVMPVIPGLPAVMDAREFNRKYGSVGSPAYEKLSERIAEAVAACSLYR